MKYYPAFIFVILLATLLSLLPSPAAQDAEQGAEGLLLRAASEALAYYREALKDEPDPYGLSESLGVVSLTLGEPVELWVLDPQDRSKDSPVFSGNWIFPVLVDRRIQLVLWISVAEDGSYRRGAFGMRPLASTLSNVLQFSSDRNLGEVQLVTFSNFPVFYSTFPEEPQVRYLELQGFDLDAPKFLEPTEMFRVVEELRR